MSDPQLIPNSFSSYELTEEQELQGCVLSTDQRCVLQNKLSEIAEQKLQLEVDPVNAIPFVQEEAYLRGQMDTIQWLLDQSVTAAEVLYNTIPNEE